MNTRSYTLTLAGNISYMYCIQQIHVLMWRAKYTYLWVGQPAVVQVYAKDVK